VKIRESDTFQSRILKNVDFWKKAATINIGRDFCSGKAAATGHAHADISGVTARIFCFIS